MEPMLTPNALTQSLADYRDARWAEIDATMSLEGAQALGLGCPDHTGLLDTMIKHQYTRERATALEAVARSYQGHYVAALVAFAQMGFDATQMARYLLEAGAAVPCTLPLAPVNTLADPVWISAAVRARGAVKG
jgi:hypothetical protein